jgi:hypothetical protein
MIVMLSVALSLTMPSVIMLSVIMLNVVVPLGQVKSLPLIQVVLMGNRKWIKEKVSEI